MEDIITMPTDAEQLNNLTYTDYYIRLKLLAQSVFEWENLPNGIDGKWIERALFESGFCMFFYDFNLGYMVADCTKEGTDNYQKEATSARPVAHDILESKSYNNYLGRDLANGKDPKDYCVVIQNNDKSRATKHTLKLYAMRLTELERSIDVNVGAQRTPYFIKCKPKLLQTVKNIFKKVKSNEPAIYVDKSLDDNAVGVLRTDAPIVFPQLQIQKHAVWNEAMTFIGINNANMDKRERLVAGEVQANNEQIELSAYTMLKARERACDLINKLFPDLEKPVSVKIRNRTETQIIKKEDGENGREIHGDPSGVAQ